MSRSRLVFRLFLLFVVTAFAERMLFALRHAEVAAGLAPAAAAEALLAGLRFDLAVAAMALAAASLVTYLLHRLLRAPFAGALRAVGMPTLTLLVLLHGADSLYYGEAGRHLGYELKEGLNSAGDLTGLLLGRYRNELLIQLALLAPLLIAAHRLLRAPRPAGVLPAAPRRRRSFLSTLLPEAELLAWIAAAVLIVRGGLQSIPLEPLRAQALGNSAEATLALNGAYNALHALGTRGGVQPVIALIPPDAEARAALHQLYGAPPPVTAGARPLNVIVLLLESWSGAYVTGYGDDLPTTPEFAALRGRALTTTAMLAGGHRTTEGMFATLCSAQNPLGGTIAQTQLQQYPYRCLPQILGERGYRTAFFQGTHENTSGTGDFARLLGFSESFARESIADHALPYNGWGLQDPDVYAAVLAQVRASKGPFFFAVNTNSTHDLALPPGWQPKFAGDDTLHRYLSVLNFADHALGEFVRTLEREGRLADTLLVIQADHAGMTPERNPSRYLIPFALLGPGIEARRIDTVASQRDVAPTLLDLLGLPPAPSFTGRSLLAGGAGGADYYQAGRLGWFEGTRGVEMSIAGDGPVECMSADAGFPATACGDDAEALRRRALAFTRTEQWLLFGGHTRDFAAYARTLPGATAGQVEFALPNQGPIR